MVFDIQNLVIKTPGTYELELAYNDIPLASRILTFRQIQPKKNPSQE